MMSMSKEWSYRPSTACSTSIQLRWQVLRQKPFFQMKSIMIFPRFGGGGKGGRDSSQGGEDGQTTKKSSTRECKVEALQLVKSSDCIPLWDRSVLWWMSNWCESFQMLSLHISGS